VAGRQRAVERRLRELARTAPRVRPFGFTDRVPELMAAADVVVALPGATTCSEARVVGRPLLLLDVMPGHGRDNLLHELELGRAGVCGPGAAGITAGALALLEQTPRPAPAAGPAPRWEPAYAAALQRAGVDLRRAGLPQAAALPGGAAGPRGAAGPGGPPRRDRPATAPNQPEAAIGADSP
jgi:hypothetical protein